MGSFQAVLSSHILEATVRCPVTAGDVGNYNPVSSSIHPLPFPFRTRKQQNQSAFVRDDYDNCLQCVMDRCARSILQRALQTAGDGLQKRKMSKNRCLQADHFNIHFIFKPLISSLNSKFFSCLTCWPKLFYLQLLC